MTDTYEDAIAASPEIDLGQVEEMDGATFSEDIPLLPVDDYRDHYVTVKVDGAEQKVPLSEALAGYQRQADYTRKTQELATQRDQLQWANAVKAALDSDPKGTIDLLAAHYGISRAEAQRQVDSDPWLSNDYGETDWETGQAPLDPRYQEIDSRLRRFEEQQAQAQLQSEISRLQSTYGEDFNPQEVVTEALRLGSTDLEAVFRQIAFDRVYQRQRADVARQAQEQQIAAKRSASIVAGGSSAAPAAHDEVGPIRSIADAWNAAKRQMGA